MKDYRWVLLVGLWLLSPVCGFTQQLVRTISGTVLNQATRTGIPFATLKTPDGRQGVVADLEGHFDFPNLPVQVTALELSSIGFQTKSVALVASQSVYHWQLSPAAESELAEVTIQSPERKIRRILRAAIDARDQHNPEKKPAYQCSVYYKMMADVDLLEFPLNDSEKQWLRNFQERQHLLVAETYSRRLFRKPASLHEEILATRFSGLSSPAFTNLITDVLPFQIQSDFIRLGQLDYPNPVAKGFESRYRFRLREEFQNEGDTIWVLAYEPRKNVRGLQGTLTIRSDGYVVQQMIADARDSALRQSTRIDIQYAKTEGQWFPEKLNYRMEWRSALMKGQDIFISGTSRIDSVLFSLPPGYRFDNAHTATLASDAVKTEDSSWTAIRPDPLSAKDTQTYHFNDSFANSLPTDNIVRLASALPKGLFPIWKLDVNLNRVYSFNDFEGNRYGLGIQTSDKISKKCIAGAWGGRGQHDGLWKYGGFGEIFFDRYQEQVLRLSYDRDLRDPGRVFLDPSLDKGYIRQYLIQRADLSERAAVQLRNRIGYLSTELDVAYERITPLYGYRFTPYGDTSVQLSVKEATLRLRYAFGEKRAYSFGTYLPISTKYPILYASVTAGTLSPQQPEPGIPENRYLQLIGGIQFQKHINRLGTSHLLLIGGDNISDAPLPISRLFAARGYRLGNFAAFSFGNFYTLRPYDLYNDAFISLHFRHQFDFHFYKTSFSYPSLSVGYSGIYGEALNYSLHEGIEFHDAAGGYHEAGLALHDLLRLKVYGLAYAGVHAGYYIPLSGNAFFRNGATVLGIEITL
ncbi:MAG: hypothetical protein EOP52_10580 [Sphingobacteriales bacterium]|nr:MAG: hypothetical protein EOP52_10580 [Sphingobacteriales bacterium]